MTTNSDHDTTPTPRERSLIVREPDKRTWRRIPKILSNTGWFSILLGSIAVLFSLWMLLAYASSWRTEMVLHGMETDVELRTRKANAELENKLLRQASLANQEAKAVASSKLMSALSEVSGAQVAIDQFKANLNAIDTGMRKLLTGEIGQKVAADEPMTEQAESIVRIIKEMVRPDVNAIEQQLMLLQKPLLNAQQDLPADFSPSVALLQSIKDIRHQVEVANSEANRNLGSLESFIGRASRLVGGKSDETLQVVLDTMATNRRNQENRLLANELDASRRENAAMTTRATMEKERQIAEAAKAADEKIARERAARVKLEAKIEADRIAADAEAKRIAAAKARLEQEFQRDLPNIRRYLGPLFGDGYDLRGNGSSKPGPASFSQLVTLGTQAGTKDGLIAMIKVLDAGWNDRTETKWISANYRYKEPKQWSSLDMAPLQNAHDLFRKYGPLLVEKGMLAP